MNHRVIFIIIFCNVLFNFPLHAMQQQLGDCEQTPLIQQNQSNHSFNSTQYREMSFLKKTLWCSWVLSLAVASIGFAEPFFNNKDFTHEAALEKIFIGLAFNSLTGLSLISLKNMQSYR